MSGAATGPDAPSGRPSREAVADGGPDPRSAVRRRDRAKDDAWIESFLEAAPFGFLATVADGRPFLNSNLFVYDRDARAIWVHTARTGRVRDNVQGGEPVCFSAAVMGRLLPADQALEFSVEYASVVAFGRAVVVEDDEERTRGLQLLLDNYAPHLHPGRDYRPIQPEELKRTAVYRIDVDAWSGKQKAESADFPGAFAVDPPTVPFGVEAGPDDAEPSGEWPPAP